MGEGMAYGARIALVTVCLLVAAIAWAPAAGAGSDDLASARGELRLRVETERRMREEFENLLGGGAMSAAEIADFESYLAQLSALVEVQRRLVARLEGAATPGTPEATGALPEDFDRGRTNAENIAMLDAELGASLSEFDEKLLREQESIAKKSRAASTAESGAPGSEGAAGEGAADGDAGQAGDGAESADADGRQGEAGADAQGDAAEEGGEGTDGAGGSEQVAAAGGSGGREGPAPATPADIPDGSDDDIVARQLREAAENEQDPELREKLWDEYRKYKKR